jgi:uncharacterized protein (DUF2344 family)
MTRALSRSGIIVQYDKGFNPKPKISFSNPIPLGVESLAEYCDNNFSQTGSLQGAKPHGRYRFDTLYF